VIAWESAGTAGLSPASRCRAPARSGPRQAKGARTATPRSGADAPFELRIPAARGDAHTRRRSSREVVLRFLPRPSRVEQRALTRRLFVAPTHKMRTPHLALGAGGAVRSAPDPAWDDRSLSSAPSQGGPCTDCHSLTGVVREAHDVPDSVRGPARGKLVVASLSRVAER
jgi:hypothetical protein